MNTKNSIAQDRAAERKTLVNAMLSSKDAKDMGAELLADLQLIAHNGVNDTTHMGPHIGVGIHVYRVTFPRMIVLSLAHGYRFAPPPVIELLYHARHDKLSYRSVPYSD